MRKRLQELVYLTIRVVCPQCLPTFSLPTLRQRKMKISLEKVKIWQNLEERRGSADKQMRACVVIWIFCEFQTFGHASKSEQTGLLSVELQRQIWVAGGGYCNTGLVRTSLGGFGGGGCRGRTRVSQKMPPWFSSCLLGLTLSVAGDWHYYH